MSVISVGFYGKLPARGDFVRIGLPRDFIDPWDAWLQSVLAGSRALMGEAWLPAFLEAPVWRFSLPAGMCGPPGCAWPDTAKCRSDGPLFPTGVRCTEPAAHGCRSKQPMARFVEAAGLAALEQDISPEEIAAMLAAPDLAVDATGATDAEWWTAGSARVQPTRMGLQTMPDSATYAAMLGTENEPEAGERTWESTS